MNNKLEKAQQLRAQAMPEVKILVKKYGRSIISGCIQRLAKYDKNLKVLADKQREVRQLKKELNK